MLTLNKSLSITTAISFILIILFATLLPVSSFAQTLQSSQPNKQYSSSSIRVKLKNSNSSTLLNKSNKPSVEVFGSNINNINLLQIKPLFAEVAPETSSVTPQSIATDPEATELSKYYEITVPEGTDTLGFSKQLKQLPEIEEAYPSPLPAPLPVSPNFESKQLVRFPAPRGTNASFAETWPGALGENVKIIDIEDGWNSNHEDLSKARVPGARINNGTPIGDQSASATDHGTAVLGVLVGDKNTFGVTGIVPKASVGMINAHNKYGSYNYNVSTAIVLAAKNLKAGDVILIEQQTWGPVEGSLVPVEYIPDAYDAIKYATSKNINVIEAAGNGNVDLDYAEYYGDRFPFNKPNSGAIMVGAGASCINAELPLRSKLGFSNFGKRLDLQGLGDCVVTTGVGDLYSAGDINRLYTHNFAGTSSASAVVAGNVASFVSSYKKLNGVTPNNDFVKSTFKATGKAQVSNGLEYDGNIGPLPDLSKALLKTDLKPPSTPAKLTATINSSNKVVLNWLASTDNVEVANYKVICNYVQAGNLAGNVLKYTFAGSKPKTTYNCGVIAVDRSGKVSAMSNIVKVTTR